MDSDRFRTVTGDTMAQGFLIEVLLSEYFRKIPDDMWDKVKTALTSSAFPLQHYEHLNLSEEESDFFADVMIRMRAAMESYIDRAMHRALVAKRHYEASRAKS